MKFSVLISVYSKENSIYFRESLESVINQTVIPTEIVIIKDGPLSVELETVIGEYKNKYPKLFKIVSLEKNLGLGKALKKGVESCTYNIIARMDSDDICRNDRFEKQIEVFKENPEVCIVGSYIKEFNEKIDDMECIRKVPLNDFDIKKYIKKRNPFNHMTVMFKKDVIIECGNYQECFYAEDYYLWSRIAINNNHMCNIPECLVFARVGNGMYERRGGIFYFKQEIKLQKRFLKLGLINIYELSRNLIIRFVARIVPNSARKKIYMKFLRN